MSPLSCLTITSPICSIFSNSPAIRIDRRVLPSLISPPDIEMFSDAIALSMSKNVNSSASSLRISTFTLISFSLIPLILTFETSSIVSILSSRYSAYPFSSSRLKSPDRLIFNMGNSDKSISITIGSINKSLGNSLLALSTASLTSNTASSIFTLVLNSIITRDAS